MTQKANALNPKVFENPIRSIHEMTKKIWKEKMNWMNQPTNKWMNEAATKTKQSRNELNEWKREGLTIDSLCMQEIISECFKKNE